MAEAKYTVVLLRSPMLAEENDDEYGKDIYVALTKGDSYRNAIANAQSEAYDADIAEGLHPDHPTDYHLCVLFEGHCDPKLFGWQAS